MASVYETQLAHPQGFRNLARADTLYNPAANAHAKPDLAPRADAAPLHQINFTRAGAATSDTRHPLASRPDSAWLEDHGQPFGPRGGDGLSYGWINGTPNRVFVQPWNRWNDVDLRYRTYAEWTQADNLQPVSEWTDRADLAWRIVLPPGRYDIFLAVGSHNTPVRFDRNDAPLPFRQVNDFLINDVQLTDPRQPDVREDAYWTTVTVGDDRLLTLRPAPSAITPRVQFIQIYPTTGSASASDLGKTD
jgi:hypothetical protein